MSISVICIGFVAMLVLMFLSMPVAVAILTVGGVGGYLAYGMPLVETMGGVVWGTLNNPVMTAIPLFMLLGELLLRGGIADKMFDALAVWLGKLPGGLLHTNIGTCALFSATSGSSRCHSRNGWNNRTPGIGRTELSGAPFAWDFGGRRHIGHPYSSVGEPSGLWLVGQCLGRAAVYRRGLARSNFDIALYGLCRSALSRCRT